jgi:Flp pilus assembly secretin CpaC
MPEYLLGTSAMRPLHTVIAALIAVSTPLSALAAPLNVPINQVKKVPFAGLASTVTPGNPAIANVTVIDDHTVLVQGLKAGVTNLYITDRAGRVLFNDRIIVSTTDLNATMISRGGNLTAYACEPFCLVIANPGQPVPGSALH